MATPSSIINICADVALNNSYEHTIYFDTREDQQTFFASKVVRTLPAYTYLRKSWSIKVYVTRAEALRWTYLYFQNDDQKIYYYFITDIEYVNDNVTELFLELDVMQTYHFDYQLLECFVEREHVALDAIGANVVEEDIDPGEYKNVYGEQIAIGELCILMLATYNPLTTTEEFTSTVVSAIPNGIFSGLGLYAVRQQDWIAWGVKLQQLAEWGKSEGIVAMWMYPKNLVRLVDGEEWDDGNVTHNVAGAGYFEWGIARNTSLYAGYTPRNNKLLTYPYNFMYLTNHSGSGAVFKYEDFSTPATECTFRVVGALSPESGAKIYPLSFKGISYNYDEGVSMGAYPSCAWNEDVYKLWLAQNQNQHALGTTIGAVKVVAGGASILFGGGLKGDGLSTMVSGAAEIASIVAQKRDKEIQPPQARGSHSSSVNVCAGFYSFAVFQRTVNREYAIMIDDYFDMFGYACRKLKVPNRAVRENWCYTKTIGCHIKGNFATADQMKIESIYNKGITFWQNGDYIGRYDLSNTCVSTGDLM